MVVEKINPCGYCKGVLNAINTALLVANKYPHEKIYCIGQIVHNDYVNNMLKDKGIIILQGNKDELIDSIDSGVVIFSAHGSEQRVLDKAKDKGLIVIDTICKFVSKSMDTINTYTNQGYEIIYVGKKGHPESIAATSLSSHVHLIEKIDDLEKLNDVLKSKKLLLTNQTTISISDIKDIYEAINKINSDVILLDEICNATRLRQEVVANINNKYDGLIIVGDNTSNNTKSLALIAKSKNISSIMVNNYKMIDKAWLKGKNYIGVISGTSTPIELVDEIITKLNNQK